MPYYIVLAGLGCGIVIVACMGIMLVLEAVDAAADRKRGDWRGRRAMKRLGY